MRMHMVTEKHPTAAAHYPQGNYWGLHTIGTITLVLSRRDVLATCENLMPKDDQKYSSLVSNTPLFIFFQMRGLLC